ncbi:prephenate dehydratase [Azospirillum picis]|uniref:prephenate dehydratase n=1 Tax=Azospirillum picis TaxID=488438 RepID=A0ABU0MJS9_9PROT|nr:prephenate dehydratase [Azospirillum picis]MBP2300051.1 prephenate dehydratase [Azospirillum picis]MDQ0533711.1 prephenate dehydratase [Azospirillum picis]
MATANIIAFQGFPGAYSDLACRNARPTMTTMPCATFEDAFAAVRDGRASLAMIPVENSIAGRVADNHYLLPEGRLHIIGEHFQRVNHQLLAPRGATLEGLKTVRSHIQALSQCQTAIRGLGLQTINHADTAGAAKEIAALNDPQHAAIASSLAAEIYGLDTLKSGIEDAEHNTTRFLILAREPKLPALGSCKTITTFVFRVRSVPAALYKALGGFATNGVNMTKLESYMVGGRFTQTQFYADVEGHPDERPLRLALEELDFFAHEVKILGVYPANPFRYQESQRVGED